jgi:hypothetical protein
MKKYCRTHQAREDPRNSKTFFAEALVFISDALIFMPDTDGGGCVGIERCDHRGIRRFSDWYYLQMRRSTLLLVLLLTCARVAAAQTPAPPQRSASEPGLRRWFEFQQFAIATRYRFIRNSSEVN